MKTVKLFLAIVLALSVSGCLSNGLLLGKYGNPPEHVAKAPVEHLYEVSLLQYPTKSQPVVEVQLIDHVADNTPVVITSSQGTRMVLISDEHGKLQVNLVAHFAEKQLAPGEVVLNLSINNSFTQQLRIGSAARFANRYIDLPRGQYLWMPSPSANAIKKAEMFRSTRPWRAALNERRGDYLSLCRSGGIRGWIVKAGSKPYYLVDQEMPCLSDG